MTVLVVRKELVGYNSVAFLCIGIATRNNQRINLNGDVQVSVIMYTPSLPRVIPVTQIEKTKTAPGVLNLGSNVPRTKSQDPSLSLAVAVKMEKTKITVKANRETANIFHLVMLMQNVNGQRKRPKQTCYTTNADVSRAILVMASNVKTPTIH